MNLPSHLADSSGASRLQIFVSDLGATGVVRNAIALANEAAASGYQVRLLTCNPDGLLRAQLRPDVTIVRLNEGSDAARPRRAQMQRALLAYRKHSRDWAPDIMLSAGNHGHLLSTIAWLGLRGTKVLRISNDINHGSPSWLTRVWRAAKFAVIGSLADKLVLVSQAQGKHSFLARQIAVGKADIIANGVDADAVRAAAASPCAHPWRDEPRTPYALAVGRHVKQKNFDVLLRAFAKARAERPLRLMILGEGEPSALDRLRSLASELGVEGDVQFVPATGNPFPYIASASALILPSLWEGSANVLLEAIACGTAVVASRTAGDADHVLGSGKFGLLVDPCDVDQLADAILRQVRPDSVRPGNRAADFGRAEAMRKYIQLFDDLSRPRAQGEARVSRSPTLEFPASSAARA